MVSVTPRQYDRVNSLIFESPSQPEVTLKNNNCRARPHLAQSGQSHGKLHLCPACLDCVPRRIVDRGGGSAAAPLLLRCSSNAPPMRLE